MRFRTSRSFSANLLAGILVVGLACNKAPDDSQLTSQIQSKLDQDSGLHGKPITVQTSGGVVTLSGSVDNETQRVAAARYASSIPGITQVVNNLQTTPAVTASNPKAHASKPVLQKPSSKHRPSVSRHRPEPDSAEMAAATPPPAAADNATVNQNPTPTPSTQVTPATPPVPPPAKKVTVPVGTSMVIRLLDPIDSEKAQVGQTFRATLDAPLPTDGDAVPSGYDVKGHIEDVKSAGKFAGQSLVVLQLDSITVSGKSYARG
jgi:hypothetical protein